jgi:hypothetical protein
MDLIEDMRPKEVYHSSTAVARGSVCDSSVGPVSHWVRERGPDDTCTKVSCGIPCEISMGILLSSELINI